MSGRAKTCENGKDAYRSTMTRKGRGTHVYKFKGFDSTLCGDDMSTFEAMVNAWMEDEHPRIRHMCQSVRGEHILLSFVYEDTRELEQRIALQESVQNELTGITAGFPRIFDDELIVEDPATNPRIPATPPPMNVRAEDRQ